MCGVVQICSFRELFSGRFDDAETSFLLDRFNGDLQNTINFVMFSQCAKLLRYIIRCFMCALAYRVCCLTSFTFARNLIVSRRQNATISASALHQPSAITMHYMQYRCKIQRKTTAIQYIHVTVICTALRLACRHCIDDSNNDDAVTHAMNSCKWHDRGEVYR